MIDDCMAGRTVSSGGHSALTTVRGGRKEGRKEGRKGKEMSANCSNIELSAWL